MEEAETPTSGAWMYTEGYKERYLVIHQMEAINLLVAYRTLAHVDNHDPANILILTDNISSSFALMSGQTRDPVLASCVREHWLEAAKHQDKISIEHRPGSSIPLADALSQMTISIPKADYVRTAVAQLNLKFLSPVINNYAFFDHTLWAMTLRCIDRHCKPTMTRSLLVQPPTG